MCKHCLSRAETKPLGEAAPGGAICASLQRQRCELSEEAARLGFTDGKPLGLFSTRQAGERGSRSALRLQFTVFIQSPFLGHKNLGSGFMGGRERTQPWVVSHTSLHSPFLEFQKEFGCKIMSCQMEAKI